MIKREGREDHERGSRGRSERIVREAKREKRGRREKRGERNDVEEILSSHDRISSMHKREGYDNEEEWRERKTKERGRAGNEEEGSKRKLRERKIFFRVSKRERGEMIGKRSMAAEGEEKLVRWRRRRWRDGEAVKHSMFVN